MPDRRNAPLINQIEQIDLPSPNKYFLDNGIPVYEINKGTQEIIKIEVVFHAGRPYEQKKLAARATASLIKEGSVHRSSAEISETIDFYGGTLGTPYNLDTSNIVLYSLNRHFEQLLPLAAEAIKTPVFPQDELEAYIKKSKQSLQVDLQKNDVVAYRKITEFIFGADHPYGYNSFPETYDFLSRKDLLDHHQKNYTKDNCSIFISGKSSPEIIGLLNQYLGKEMPQGKSMLNFFPKEIPTAAKVKIPHADNVQTAIRIGRKLFNRKHEDYNGMYLVNTILGGYFGSRLMNNIREDKGYTYNIYSAIDTMHEDGCFYIGTEVGNEFAEATKEEIYKEIYLLQNEYVEEQELQMVRNYLLGNLLTMLDGPFNIGEVIKTMVIEDLSTEAFDSLVQTIKTISPEEIQSLAKKYFKPEDLWEVIVG
ncbi:MAG: zinc protease [Saprospiraceae bacterium]|jgi:zinc protease